MLFQEFFFALKLKWIELKKWKEINWKFPISSLHFFSRIEWMVSIVLSIILFTFSIDMNSFEMIPINVLQKNFKGQFSKCFQSRIICSKIIHMELLNPKNWCFVVQCLTERLTKKSMSFQFQMVQMWNECVFCVLLFFFYAKINNKNWN